MSQKHKDFKVHNPPGKKTQIPRDCRASKPLKTGNRWGTNMCEVFFIENHVLIKILCICTNACEYHELCPTKSHSN